MPLRNLGIGCERQLTGALALARKAAGDRQP
jgi:hypothetical protein